MRIKKGDTVKIIAGKDKGKEGKILRIDSKKNRVSVEGVNVYKKHVKPKKQDEKGEVIDVSRPLSISNISLICPNCKEPTRIGKKEDEDEIKRYCKKCNKFID
ncbi:MAG: 50S ribosomal protein L24 [Candidatus Paceibacterota bacterium]